MNVEIWTWPHNSFSENIRLEFSALVLCSAWSLDSMTHTNKANWEAFLGSV
jgi:hypothetical protein